MEMFCRPESILLLTDIMNIFNLDSLCNMFVRPTRQTYKKSDLGIRCYNRQAAHSSPLEPTKDVSIAMMSHSLLDANLSSVLYFLHIRSTNRTKSTSV
jgi:hypothetical protein